jgi:hypothetical protein
MSFRITRDFCTKCGQQIKGKVKGTVATPYCETCFYALFESEENFWKLHGNITPIEMSKDPLDKWYGVIAIGIILGCILAGFFVGLSVKGNTIQDMYNTCDNACTKQNHIGAEAWHFNSVCECEDGTLLSMPPLYEITVANKIK